MDLQVLKEFKVKLDLKGILALKVYRGLVLKDLRVFKGPKVYRGLKVCRMDLLVPKVVTD
jgi:hypothetical protein